MGATDGRFFLYITCSKQGFCWHALQVSHKNIFSSPGWSRTGCTNSQRWSKLQYYSIHQRSLEHWFSKLDLLPLLTADLSFSNISEASSKPLARADQGTTLWSAHRNPVHICLPSGLPKEFCWTELEDRDQLLLRLVQEQVSFQPKRQLLLPWSRFYFSSAASSGQLWLHSCMSNKEYEQ